MTRSKTHVAARVGALLAIVALAGCGSGTEPTPAIPSLVGEYAGTWTQDWTIDGQPAAAFACPCTLSVPSQTGNIFFGRSVLSPPCDQGIVGRGAGGVLAISDGRIESSGALRFRFSEDLPIGVYGGCAVTVMDAFVGTLSGATISASRNEAYDCTVADGHRYSLTIRLVASR